MFIGAALGLGMIGGLMGPGAASSLGAEPLSVDAARERLDRLDETLAAMKGDLDEIARGYRAPLARETGRLQRRMREAEVQALLGDHFRASVLLFDVVERPEYRADPQYPEAVFLLAESLRRAGQARAARGYYLQLAQDASGPRLAQVVLGLLDIASVTGDFSGIESLVRRAKAGRPGELAPQLDFAFGKAAFRGAGQDVTRLTRALQAFRSVPPGLSVSAPAAYYEGVTLVRMGRIEEALTPFRRTLELAGSHPDTERVRELAHLSLGRIHQELGHTAEALDAYQGVSKDSIYFADMLYEVAWVHVRGAEAAAAEEESLAAYQRALDALELLLAAAPRSRLVPEAKVLQGNLQIRLGEQVQAYATFESIVSRYGGSRAQLEQLLATQRDARTFFDQLVAADLEDLEGTALVPPMVVTLSLDNPDIRRAVGVRRDLKRTADDLEQAREMVRTLEAALQSEQRFGMFPGLRKARVKALTVQNRLLAAEGSLLRLERRLMAPHLDEATRTRLEAAQVQGAEVEQDIAALPTTDEGIEVSRDELEDRYEEVALRAFTMLEKVRRLQAQLQAVKHWMRSQNVELSERDAAITAERMAQAQSELAALDEALAGVRAEVDRAALLSRGDGGWARAERLRRELYASIDEQAALLNRARARAPSEVRGLTARIDQQRGALRDLERELVGLQNRLEQAVEERVDQVRQQVLGELRAIEAERQEQQRLASAAEAFLGPIARRTAEDVGEDLQSFVVEADVGILDVAWARKRERTDEVTELVRELARRSGELEDEFGEVLRDE